VSRTCERRPAVSRQDAGRHRSCTCSSEGCPRPAHHSRG
jgi:hypothetical protein